MISRLRGTTMLSGKPVDIATIVKWSKHAKQLSGSIRLKAKRFLAFDCIKYIGRDLEFGSKYCFLCLPLNTESSWFVDGRQFKKTPFVRDYNSSEYKIYMNQDKVFECNCQGWQTKAKKGELSEDGVNCAHTLALFLAFKAQIFGVKKNAK